MEPRIQYAQTKDGVSIAYASRGQGSVLVLAPAAWCTTTGEASVFRNAK